jgi:Arc/MetJ family transcription regulator
VAIDAWSLAGHTIHMKRTNLVLDEAILAEAQRVTGERTYSGTVNRALQELVRRARARQILDLGGSGAWRGDLAMMREDRDPAPRRRRGAR